MKYIAGFIGCGNMGGTLANAVCSAIGGANVALCDLDSAKVRAISEKHGATALDIGALAAAAKFIFLGVKPQGMASTLGLIKDALASNDDFILVTMAAGLTKKSITDTLGYECKVIRIMPNTPAAVGEGMILCSYSDGVSDLEKAQFLTLLANAGLVDEISEDKIDAASAVSGCGPAFAYIFAEALADAGVECGLTREQATKYAAQMILGAAKMVRENGNPAALKDAVCSPGGTTIAGVHALEDCGFRSAAMNAVTAAYKRTLELKK